MKIVPAHESGGVLFELRADEAELPGSEDQAAAAPVLRLKQLLVPVDLSESATKALRYAVSFAKQFGAELTLLHVVQKYLLAHEVPSFELQQMERAARQLEALRLPLAAGLESNSLVRSGIAHLEIVAAANDIEADLIIISTHGRTGLAHALLGSTAEKIVRHAVCPVLVVRDQERDFIEERSVPDLKGN